MNNCDQQLHTKLRARKATMSQQGSDSSRDESELRRFFQRHFQEITQWSSNHVKDLIGLPFVPPNSQQPPFSVEQQQQQRRSVSDSQPRSRYWSTHRRWQRGDPIVALFTVQATPPRAQLHAGVAAQDKATRQLEHATAAAEQELLALDPSRRQVLNLPDGSTLMDLCYPGWEVAILPSVEALDHFWARRWLFGDFYGHLLTGRTSSRMATAAGELASGKQRENPFLPQRSSPSSSEERNLHASASGSDASVQKERKKPGPLTEEQILAAYGKSEGARAAHRHAVFEHRRSKSSLQEAAEAQQRRGVPFDAHPISSAPEPDEAIKDSPGAPNEVVKVEIIAQQILTAQGQTGRFSVRRTFRDGRTEVSDASRSALARPDATSTKTLDATTEKQMRAQFDASFDDSS